MTDPLGRLRAVFAASGIELDGPELADALWLATRLPTGSAAPVARALAAAGPPVDDSPQPKSGPTPPPEDTAPAVGAHATPPAPGESRTADEPDPAAGTGPGTSRPVRLPGPRALPRQLQLGRALRPLKRSIPSVSARELDEAATAAARADTGVPCVVARPAPERWLRLIQVVDGGLSMELWRGHARELRSVLERGGAFREVCTVAMDRALQRPYTDLADPTGRTVVLVLTDGTGPAWADGRVRSLLDHVARLGPAAVVHTLPRRMWPGTHIAADTWHVAQHRRGEPNATWTVTHPVLPRTFLPTDRIPVPVLELVPASLAAWAGFLTAVRRATPLPLWAPPTVDHPTPSLFPPTTSATRTPRPALSVTDFRRAASRDAYRLAAHLAAYSPVTVPVMRLVHACLPGAGDPAPLAEVLLGGLLQPLDGAGIPAFEFSPEARYLLLEAVPTAELVETGRRVANRMAELVGRSSDFPAWLTTPAEGALDQGDVPFARIEAGTLGRFGITQTRPAPLPEQPVRALRGESPYQDEPYFYLSYSRRDDEEAEDVRRFYEDLQAQLTRLGADLETSPPFSDMELTPGQDWLATLSRNIGRARTLVVLYSPALFRSRWAGREWAAFEERLREHQERTGQFPGSLIPVQWSPLPDDLPEEVRHIQYLGVPTGLRGLDRRDPDAYQRVVRQVAAAVRDAAETNRLATHETRLDTIQEAFADDRRPVRLVRPTLEPPLDHPSGRGEVITFYSFMGGTGRTMALANVAWILARNGLRVLAVDWDLEAPGLPRFFHPLMPTAGPRSTPGLTELLAACAQDLRERRDERLAYDPADHRPRVRAALRSHVVPVAGLGRLDILPAGAPASGRRSASGSDWRALTEDEDGRAFLGVLREEMATAYDYVLIDSRTGDSNASYICTRLLPDTIVSCFSMSMRSIQSSADFALTAARSAAHHIRVIPVLMRVEADQPNTEAARELAGELFGGYDPDVEIPYRPYYAYEDIPAVLGDRPGRPESLLAAYERLTARLTGGRVTHLPPGSEEERVRLLNAYRKHPHDEPRS
ncbi:TIR-like protein FxsC [Streptomyces sp. NPDC086549]|uniref:TIR-like protein FxsC n=1 Tax=Streptomyces sp. NPDC086549 TaxID=3365752 RepID=UPI00381EBCD2